MENRKELIIASYIEKMMSERKKEIFESDEYIQQDNDDLEYLEKRYENLDIPYVMKRIADDYIACLKSRDERYADLSYAAGIKDTISLLIDMRIVNINKHTFNMTF